MPTSAPSAQRPVSAWAIEAARRRLGMSREELADQLTAATGEEWSYNKVRRVELGERAVKVSELDALADILQAPVWFLVRGWAGLSGDNNGGLPIMESSQPLAA